MHSSPSRAPTHCHRAALGQGPVPYIQQACGVSLTLPPVVYPGWVGWVGGWGGVCAYAGAVLGYMCCSAEQHTCVPACANCKVAMVGTWSGLAHYWWGVSCRARAIVCCQHQCCQRQCHRGTGVAGSDAAVMAGCGGCGLVVCATLLRRAGAFQHLCVPASGLQLLAANA